jgi:hypothetical protein
MACMYRYAHCPHGAIRELNDINEALFARYVVGGLPCLDRKRPQCHQSEG